MDSFLQEANTKIQAAIEHLKRELAVIRAGKANPSLVENISVNVYGSQMKLVELGTISAPQPSLLTISVWDASIIKDIEKALLEANLGITPSIDSQTIRLPIPPLTEERRVEYAKMANQKGEEGRVSIRQIRADEREKWTKESEDGQYGEDELFRREKILQDLITRADATVDELVKLKEEELKQI